jgi:hypothetical protein
MSTPFSEQDRQFLKAVGINAKPTLDETRRPVAQHDGTVRLLEKYGIPVTRENYLRLASAGNPPQEPLNGEIEAELPLEQQMANINNAPSAGWCEQPSRTTLHGFPLRPRCGRSTRNVNAFVYVAMPKSYAPGADRG